MKRSLRFLSIIALLAMCLAPVVEASGTRRPTTTSRGQSSSKKNKKAKNTANRSSNPRRTTRRPRNRGPRRTSTARLLERLGPPPSYRPPQPPASPAAGSPSRSAPPTRNRSNAGVAGSPAAEPVPLGRGTMSPAELNAVAQRAKEYRREIRERTGSLSSRKSTVSSVLSRAPGEASSRALLERAGRQGGPAEGPSGARGPSTSTPPNSP